MRLPYEISKLEPIVLTAGNNSRIKEIQDRLAIYNINGTYFDNTGYSATEGHKRIVEKLRDENKEYGFILEDDAYFMDNFKELYPNIINELKNIDWDLFYFGGNFLNGVKQVSQHIVKPGYVYCNHAYFIHNKVYDKIINLLTDATMIVDDIYTRSDCNIYVSYPMIITQVESQVEASYYKVNHDIMMKSYYDRSLELIKNIKGKK